MRTLHTEISHGDARQIVARFSGDADASSKDALDTFLRDLHAEIMRRGVARLVLDFQDFEFMSSIGFKSFILLLSKLQTHPEFQVEFRANYDKHWQRRSLHAIQGFVPNLVSIRDMSTET
jgi:hypothetical protein